MGFLSIILEGMFIRIDTVMTNRRSNYPVNDQNQTLNGWKLLLNLYFFEKIYQKTTINNA